VIYLGVDIVVPRKPELVWQVLADVGAYASWVEGLRHLEHEAGPSFGEGASFDVRFAHGKKTISATAEITRMRAPELLAIEVRVRERLALFVRLGLEPSPEGTRVTASSEVAQEAGVMRLLARAPGLLGAGEPERGPQRAYERSFVAFQKLVETRTAAPYR
jgi:uncharacterized protein YndB with AHSA1/START domain